MGAPERRRGNPYLFLSLGVGFVIAAAAFLGKGVSGMRPEQRAVAPPVSKERGLITPAEAAMETSLTVREADSMLSGLAGRGHLAVRSRDGALFYALPGRDNPELESME